MGELNLSNLKRPENLIKMLIIVLSLIGFGLLLTGLKCHNNNIHIASNLHFNRIVSASYFRSTHHNPLVNHDLDHDPVWPPPAPESVAGTHSFEAKSDARPATNAMQSEQAHHAFECALFKYKVKNSELFLLLVNFTYFFVTCLTLITCFVSEGFTRNMDIIFHVIGFFFYLCSTVWILVDETEIGKSYETRKNIVASASIGLVNGMLHFIHALFCIKFS